MKNYRGGGGGGGKFQHQHLIKKAELTEFKCQDLQESGQVCFAKLAIR